MESRVVVLPAADSRRELTGRAKPRIAPPTPARSRLPEFEAAAADLDIELMPHQKYAARFIMATGPDDTPLYREVCIVIARRNGKTTLLLPLILLAGRAGLQVIHTAQDRALPGETFELLADALEGSPEVKTIRRANGQETIRWAKGGRYTLVAPNHGVRGRYADIVIVDEVREQKDERLAKAILPTMATSKTGLVIYLSNAGDDESVMLNELRRRGTSGDPGRLAYLEWSASPERTIDDPKAWEESNPALGHTLTTERLLELRQSMSTAAFETEHLCRWVSSMRERLVTEAEWNVCYVQKLPPKTVVMMGVSMDPRGTRASAVVAWQQTDGKLAIAQTHDVTGEPVDPVLFGEELRKSAAKWGVRSIGFSPMTDGELAKFFKSKVPISGGNKLANASARFVSAVQGQRVMWTDAPGVTSDLVWTARKKNDRGAFEAVRSSDERPIPAALAAIYAVELASGPPPGAARIV